MHADVRLKKVIRVRSTKYRLYSETFSTAWLAPTMLYRAAEDYKTALNNRIEGDPVGLTLTTCAATDIGLWRLASCWEERCHQGESGANYYDFLNHRGPAFTTPWKDEERGMVRCSRTKMVLFYTLACMDFWQEGLKIMYCSLSRIARYVDAENRCPLPSSSS